MGNRGDLHGRDGEIVRLWKHQAWIACTMVGKHGHRVAFDTPGRYAPLFALDEVTMLAAGHRPCPQCRHDAHARFKVAWADAHGVRGGNALPVAVMDAALHAARLNSSGGQRTFRAQLTDLPSGAMVAISVLDNPSLRTAWLLWRGRMFPWSHEFYGRFKPIQAGVVVDVLTPEPIVAVLRAGYVPEVAL